EHAHIPGAVFVDLDKDLSSEVVPGKTGRHPLPLAEEFEASLQQWGLENDQQVVAYDDANGAFAARLWWMLRWAGHANVAVLDGGFNAWRDSGQVVTDGVTEQQISAFTSKPALTCDIQADELPLYAGLITDARDLARFNGESEPIDPIAGHIPNARCLPFTSNLTRSQHFKSVAELQQQFEDFGVPGDSSTVCYCGSGVTAAHNILALVHAGYPEPTLYPGSWSEWITDPNRPVATL
ncbi:MAG: sulfurtransferase, partial [bacterium]